MAEGSKAPWKVWEEEKCEYLLTGHMGYIGTVLVPMLHVERA